MAYRVINGDEPTKALLDRITASFLKERGPNFTIREVCAAAGVSIGTFYTYYESKDALIAAHLQYTDSAMMEAVAGAEDSTPEARILCVCKTYFSTLASRGTASCREVVRCMLYGHQSMEALQRSFFYRYIREQAEEGLRRGSFRPELSAESIARLVNTCCKGATQEWCQCAPELELEPYGMALVEALLRSLKTTA